MSIFYLLGKKYGNVLTPISAPIFNLQKIKYTLACTLMTYI